MESTINVSYITVFDIICFFLMIGAAIGCYRIDGKFGTRFAILLFFLGIEIIFAGFAVTLDKSNVWYQIIKISGRVIEMGAISWFLLWITKKN
jgi:surface polysaccharide O-acyltransferase-like enzyme